MSRLFAGEVMDCVTTSPLHRDPAFDQFAQHLEAQPASSLTNLPLWDNGISGQGFVALGTTDQIACSDEVGISARAYAGFCICIWYIPTG